MTDDGERVTAERLHAAGATEADWRQLPEPERERLRVEALALCDLESIARRAHVDQITAELADTLRLRDELRRRLAELDEIQRRQEQETDE